MNAMHALAIITGHTCGDACWHALEDTCRCSCGGRNHGILRDGGIQRPDRTAKIGGLFYTLVAVGDYSECEQAASETLNARFPGLDCYAYGEWGDEKMLPVLMRKASPTQAKWAECQTYAGTRALYLVWARPAGTAYVTKRSRYLSNVTRERSAAVTATSI